MDRVDRMAFLNRARSVFDRILDVLWPRICPICENLSDRPGRTVCSACLMRLPFVEQNAGCCRVCGRPVAELRAAYLCEDCRCHKPRFDRAATALHYTGLARGLVKKYKYYGQFLLLDDFCDWLEGAARARFAVEAVDCIVPMPMTLWHRIARGYSPVSYLAGKMSKRLARPCLRHVLARAHFPGRQAGLREEARRRNVKGTFKVRRPDAVRGRTVLLLDDVLTTGATLSEAAAALKRAGARCVLAVTLARSFRG